MSLSWVSWIAVAVMMAAVGVAWSRRFLAVGSIIIANVIVFALTVFGPQTVLMTPDGPRVLPAIQADLALWQPGLAAAEPLSFLQVFTSMFVHAGFLHLFMNMFVLFLLGLPFEDRVGHRPFLYIYLLGGVAGAFAHMASSWGSPTLLLGASGAVFAIIGAFALLYPNDVVAVPVFLVIRMKVLYGAMIMAALQVVFFVGFASRSNVAFLAHLGGMLAGVLLAQAYRKGRRLGTGRGAAVRIPVESLRRFAASDRAQHALTQMEANRDEEVVLESWRERFYREASCPECGADVASRGRNAVACSRGHRFRIQ